MNYSTTFQLLFGILYVPSSILALSNLFMAWSSDPGAVPLGARPLSNEDEDEDNDLAPLKSAAQLRKERKRGIRRCPRCNGNYKPTRAHHDSVTGRCIVKMDHFCPWVGNAVGALNHKFFLLFILYTCCTSVLSLIFLIIHSIRCGFYISETESSQDEDSLSASDEEGGDEIHKYPGCTNESLYSPQVIILLILSITFLIFTGCMLFEQIDAIESNTSKIARLKMKMGGGQELKRVTSEFNEMFGGSSPRIALHWFLPTKIQFPDEIKRAKVMGFDYRDEWYGEVYREKDCSRDSSKGEKNRLLHSPLEISNGAGDDDGAITINSGVNTKAGNLDNPLVSAIGESSTSNLKLCPLTNQESKQRGTVKKRKGETTKDLESMQID